MKKGKFVNNCYTMNTSSTVCFFNLINAILDFIILLFVGKLSTNWLQVSFLKQLQGNLHRGAYQPARKDNPQFISTNPMHSM